MQEPKKEPEPWELLTEEDDDRAEIEGRVSPRQHGNTKVFGENTPASRKDFLKREREIELDKRKAIFLRFICLGRKVHVAAKHAGWSDPRAVQLLAKKDPKFREAWNLANEVKQQMLIDEAFDVALNGVLEPLFKDGVPTGHYVRKKIPKIMEVVLKGGLEKKDYKGNEGGNAGVNIGVFVLPGRQTNLEQFEQQTKQMHHNQKVIDLDPEKTVDVVVQTGHSLERKG